MSQIKILPEILSNKIAAGEVVERPASVVKELVENSLDAGSTRIIVEIAQGGRSLIRVSDNGRGMNHDDALLALERYATSKIYTDRDLFSINTLGFRGEALPSIASVSRFNLVTRNPSADSGTEIVMEGGKIKNVAEIGAPPGTMVTVKQLFFNTPARRKFLKTVNTEMGHIGDRIASIALGHPAVQFRLIHNDKIVKNWPMAASAFDRVVDILGQNLKNDLHAIKSQTTGITISGWVSTPRAHRRTSRGIFMYVNGRFVRDRIVQHALFEGYSQRLVKGQFPLAVLFIGVPFEEVDVNVHPTKNEVRFARQKDVHEAVRQAVAQTLDEADRAGWGPGGASGGLGPLEVGHRQAQASGSRNAEVGHRQAQASRSRNAEVGMWPATSSVVSKSEIGRKNFEFGRNKVEEKNSEWERIPDSRPQTSYIEDPEPTLRPTPPRSAQHDARTPHPAPRTPQPGTRSSQAAIWPEKRFGGMRVIGQLHNTYILCEAEAGLILIDQHAAHERVLFERFSLRSADRKPSAQRLLVPETIELGFREAGVLSKILPDLEALGLEIEPFGGNTFVVKAVPVLLAEHEVQPLVVEIAEKIAEIGAAPGLAEALDKCRMVMACHGAIRANQALTDKQIRGLLSELDECRNPSHCPHGRPTWLRWELRTLEKSFKRIV